MAKPTIMTTVELHGESEWSAVTLRRSDGRPSLLVQDESMVIGIVGSPDELIHMADQIRSVAQNPITREDILNKIGASPDGKN